MNSVSPGTASNLAIFQSALACSMRSLLEDTKFHQMCRGPSMGSPVCLGSVDQKSIQPWLSKSVIGNASSGAMAILHPMPTTHPRRMATIPLRPRTPTSTCIWLSAGSACVRRTAVSASACRGWQLPFRRRQRRRLSARKWRLSTRRGRLRRLSGGWLLKAGRMVVSDNVCSVRFRCRRNRGRNAKFRALAMALSLNRDLQIFRRGGT